MNGIEKYFLDYYEELCGKNSCTAKDSVKQGICAFIKNDAGCEPCTADKAARIARLKMARFTLMPLHTFEVFFSSYETRLVIEKYKEKSELLALNKYKHGKTISEKEYTDFIGAFQQSLTPLQFGADYKEYEIYISDISLEVTENLRYAAGVLSQAPQKIIDRAQFSE